MKTIEYKRLEVKILLIFMLYIPYSTIYSQNCTTEGIEDIEGVIQAESNILVSQTNFGAINDGVVVNDQGVAMNSTNHYFIVDLGKEYGSGSEIKFNIWGNGTTTARKVINSEIPEGNYLSSGGGNSLQSDVNINGPSEYTYTIENPTQFIQINMTERTGFRTEWTEVTIISDCTGGSNHHGAIEVNYPSNVDLPDNAALGVNGRMLIYNGNEPIDNVTFNADIVNNFALVVAGDRAQAKDENNNLLFEADGTTPIMEDIGGGIVSRDLGIGASNLFMTLPDYVFAEDYALPTLEETKAYVQEHKHLPAIIGEEELSAQGYFRIDRMLFGQLKHLEELLLHTITQDEKIKAQKEENERLRQLAEELEAQLNVLETKKSKL